MCEPHVNISWLCAAEFFAHGAVALCCLEKCPPCDRVVSTKINIPETARRRVIWGKRARKSVFRTVNLLTIIMKNERLGTFLNQVPMEREKPGILRTFRFGPVSSGDGTTPRGGRRAILGLCCVNGLHKASLLDGVDVHEFIKVVGFEVHEIGNSGCA